MVVYWAGPNKRLRKRCLPNWCYARRGGGLPPGTQDAASHARAFCPSTLRARVTPPPPIGTWIERPRRQQLLLLVLPL